MPYCIRLQLIKDLHFLSNSPRQDSNFSNYEETEKLQFTSTKYLFDCGPGSSVGIATDYVLDGPGSNPGGDEIFRPSRPALGLTQHPVKCVPGLFRG